MMPTLPQIYDRQFKNHLPETLYKSHYELAQMFPPSKPNDWRTYLKENEHFITSETAAIAEANARSALSKLGSGASTQEVAAIKALLEKSKLINEAQKQQQQVMLTFIPSKEQQETTINTQEMQKEIHTLKEYITYLQYLAQTNRFDPTVHTYENWKKQKEGIS